MRFDQIFGLASRWRHRRGPARDPPRHDPGQAVIRWQFDEALAVDTHQAVARWWAVRRSSPAAPIPDGLVEDLQAARLGLEDSLQRGLWDVASFLPDPQRDSFKEEIAALDPLHVLGELIVATKRPSPAIAEPGETDRDDGDLIAALNERARRREKLGRSTLQTGTRRRLRDLARGRGRLAAVLKDEAACLMLRFGAVLCELIEVEPVEEEEPDLERVRALLAGLAEADARRAADAVLNDPLVGTGDRGRPVEEVTRFVVAVINVVKRRTSWQLTPTITRLPARSKTRDDIPGADVQLILDLLACHAPRRTADAVAKLIDRS